MPEKFNTGDLVVKKGAKRTVVYRVVATQAKGKGFLYGCVVAGRNAHVIHSIPGAKMRRYQEG